VPRSSSGRPLTIGAVLARLREEFPDVSISKIRFLEAEGLIEPERTPSGYRQFSAADVERLAYILRAQRDHFWPLKVIKESLEALDRGLTPDTGPSGRPVAPTPAPDPDVPDLSGPRSALRLTAAEVAASAGAEPELVDALVGFGLVRPDAAGYFDEDDLRIVHSAEGLARFGLEARHLRAFRTAADREVGLVEQAAAGRPARTAAADRVEVARLCLQLHAALVRAGLGA
jgi:DNA-binding transcriptional MerR regulator